MPPRMGKIYPMIYQYQYYTPKMDGWIQIHGWLASRPARFFKKSCPDQSSRPARQPFLFEKSGRPAGQPTMYLDPPIHFWCIFIGIGRVRHPRLHYLSGGACKSGARRLTTTGILSIYVGGLSSDVAFFQYLRGGLSFDAVSPQYVRGGPMV